MQLSSTHDCEEHEGQAAECAKRLRPKIVYPYHYRGQDVKVFEEALRGEKDIEVRLRNWY